jgi:hypothetical protein
MPPRHFTISSSGVRRQDLTLDIADRYNRESFTGLEER